MRPAPYRKDSGEPAVFPSEDGQFRLLTADFSQINLMMGFLG